MKNNIKNKTFCLLHLLLQKYRRARAGALSSQLATVTKGTNRWYRDKLKAGTLNLEKLNCASHGRAETREPRERGEVGCSIAAGAAEDYSLGTTFAAK